jgi:hypothetical protein
MIIQPMEPELQQGPAQESGEILVFLIRKETKCSECGQELWSGRMITLNRAAKRFDPEPVRLAVVAAVRHQFTNYDGLLQEGVERHEARALVSRDLEKKLEEWRQGNNGGLQFNRSRSARIPKSQSGHWADKSER